MYSLVSFTLCGDGRHWAVKWPQHRADVVIEREEERFKVVRIVHPCDSWCSPTLGPQRSADPIETLRVHSQVEEPEAA